MSENRNDVEKALEMLKKYATKRVGLDKVSVYDILDGIANMTTKSSYVSNPLDVYIAFRVKVDNRFMNAMFIKNIPFDSILKLTITTPDMQEPFVYETETPF